MGAFVSRVSTKADLLPSLPLAAASVWVLGRSALLPTKEDPKTRADRHALAVCLN